MRKQEEEVSAPREGLALGSGGRLLQTVSGSSPSNKEIPDPRPARLGPRAGRKEGSLAREWQTQAGKHTDLGLNPSFASL